MSSASMMASGSESNFCSTSYSTAREPLPPQAAWLPNPCSFLRRIAQPSPGVSDLGVRREHQAVGASQRENDGHHRLVSRAGAPRPTSGRKSHRKQMQIIEDAKQPEATLAFTGKC